ncbi:hypothetical protein ACFQMF_01725 [Halorubrum rutilum]|uniref:Uncharacterized protein n=1 Tax=Halorubrum rutilum TaxID=1364933 RepID=A0ABD6AGX3_9EURY|nr:hypothetical protein [Halorubrum rutilum]
MSDEVPVVDILAGLDGKVEKIGDEITHERTTEIDGEEKIVEYAARHGDWVYWLSAGSNGHHVTVTFAFSIVNNVATVFNEPDIKSILGLDEQKITEEHKKEAARELLSQMRPENQEKLSYHLIKLLSSPTSGFSIDTMNTGTPEAFQVTRKIFPNDSGFSQTEFNHSVQTVVSNGVNAVQLVQQAFDIEEFVESEMSPDEERDVPYVY